MVRVSTQARCLAKSDAARRALAGYWRIIDPGSAIIRRVRLGAIVARASARTHRTGTGRRLAPASSSSIWVMFSATKWS